MISANRRRPNKSVVIAVVATVSGVLLLGAVGCCCFWRNRARRKRETEMAPSSRDDVLPFRVRKHPALSQARDQRLDESRTCDDKDLDLPLLDLTVILVATDNFAPDSKIGEGGFGPVYMVR